MTSTIRIAATLNLPPQLSRRDAEAAIASSIIHGASGPDDLSPDAASIAAQLDNGQVLSLLDYSDESGCGWRNDHPCDAPQPPTSVLTLRLANDGMVDVTGTAADMLAHIGRTLYGNRWQAHIARDVGINENTIGRWLTGKTPLPADHGVFRDLLARLDDICVVRDQALEWIAWPAQEEEMR